MGLGRIPQIDLFVGRSSSPVNTCRLADTATGKGDSSIRAIFCSPDNFDLLASQILTYSGSAESQALEPTRRIVLIIICLHAQSLLDFYT